MRARDSKKKNLTNLKYSIALFSPNISLDKKIHCESYTVRLYTRLVVFTAIFDRIQ